MDCRPSGSRALRGKLACRLACVHVSRGVCDHRAAVLARFASPVANALALPLVAGPRPCRGAGQLGSLQVSQTFPLASCQLRTCRGKSIPIVGLDCVSGVPGFGLPKTQSSVGRGGIATEAAPVASSIRANTVMPLDSGSVSSRSRVCVTENLLARVTSPSSDTVDASALVLTKVAMGIAVKHFSASHQSSCAAILCCRSASFVAIAFP